MPRQLLGTSLSPLTLGLGSHTLTTVETLSLVGGENIVLSNLELVSDYTTLSRMEHEYLNHDVAHDDTWWGTHYSIAYNADTSLLPNWFKVIGNNLYVRPRSTEPIMITAKYRQRPTEFTQPTDVIPWDQFYEVFRDGVIAVVQSDIPMPEGTVAFREFITKRVYSVMSSRRIPIPDKRMNRSLWT
jgi:hypothetical protein